MRFYFVLGLVLFSCVGNSQDFSLYEKHYFNAPELNIPYRYLRPINFDSGKKYPLLIFLHGAFEKGFDNEAQLNIGGRFFLRDSIRKNYPAFVLFPQCPEADLWAYFETKTDLVTGKVSEVNFTFRKTPTDASSALMKLIDSLTHSDKIDASRIYIGGLSQGGMGVLDLVARFPQTFAAGFAICGAGNTATAKSFAGKTSLWLFHGDADDVVPVSFSRNYFKRLQKLKSDVRYSEYAGVKHNSWVNAFNEPDLMYWLFSKRKYD
jgi:predicted peptidase